MQQIWYVLATIILLLTGCSSTPNISDTENFVFDKPVTDVQKASLNALVVTGFDVEKSQPLYVEGTRSRKIGFFVGSGGETVGIWLNSIAPDKTSVRIDTAKTFVGRVGQKDWHEEILHEMEKELGKSHQ